MNLAAIFWFYKEPEVSLDHLLIFRKFNPTLKVYGLYGGRHSQAVAFRQTLGQNLDDFYVSPNIDSDWKWRHGDLVLTDWYLNRGRDLDWDSLAIIQWDTLVFDSLHDQFPGLMSGQIYLSGLRKLDAKVELKWDWTRPDKPERKNYLAFLDYVRQEYRFQESPACCLFILAIFPRAFFEKYSQIAKPEVGFLEYKIPIYARIFEVPFYQKDLGVLWFEKNKQLPLNATPIEIPKSYIQKELLKPNGRRIFHPYYKIWPI